MFISILKKHIKISPLVILTLLLIITSVLLFKTWDDWVFHRNMPQPHSDNWSYKSILTSFKPAKTGYSVFVDLDSLTLTLYEDSNAIKLWPISGGTRENTSPTGSWLVTDIDNWGDQFGGSWIALNVPWGKYGIHGTVEPWVVGNSNISHGCIRMKNSDVAELKKYMSKNIPVYIKYDDLPFRELMDGKVGSDVLQLQVMLMQLGYYSETPDGHFGSSTFKALCEFQTHENIKVDGIAGFQSWSLLQERMNRRKK